MTSIWKIDYPSKKSRCILGKQPLKPNWIDDAFEVSTHDSGTAFGECDVKGHREIYGKPDLQS